MNQDSRESALLAQQGLFYLVTGIWPVFDRESFERVTGPKTDFWLVRTTGLLLGTIGAAMLLAARHEPSAEGRLLAVGSAASLAGIDIVYASRRRIRRIYLLDAAVELALLGAWATVLLTTGRPNSHPARS